MSLNFKFRFSESTCVTAIWRRFSRRHNRTTNCPHREGKRMRRHYIVSRDGEIASKIVHHSSNFFVRASPPVTKKARDLYFCVYISSRLSLLSESWFLLFTGLFMFLCAPVISHVFFESVWKICTVDVYNIKPEREFQLRKLLIWLI